METIQMETLQKAKLTKSHIKHMAFLYNCTTHYSGKGKEMYIIGENSIACVNAIERENFNLSGISIIAKKKHINDIS